MYTFKGSATTASTVRKVSAASTFLCDHTVYIIYHGERRCPLAVQRPFNIPDLVRVCAECGMSVSVQVYSCTNCSKWLLCRLHMALSLSPSLPLFLSCRVLYSFRFFELLQTRFYAFDFTLQRRDASLLIFHLLLLLLLLVQLALLFLL